MALRKSDRVVLDTSVIVSLLLKEKFDFFVDLKYLHSTTFYSCSELLDELTHTLSYPHCRKYLNEPVSFYVDFVRDFSENIVIDESFDRAPDIKDNYLFDLAYTSKSYYLVTGDKPLLNMKQVNKIRIVSLTEFKKILSTET